MSSTIDYQSSQPMLGTKPRGRPRVHAMPEVEPGDEKLIPFDSEKAARDYRSILYMRARRLGIRYSAKIVKGGLLVRLVSVEMNEKTGLIYFIRCGDFPLLKIGFADNLKARLDVLRGMVPFKLTVERTIESMSVNHERYLHDRYHYARTHFGEWFYARPRMLTDEPPTNNELADFLKHNITHEHMRRKRAIETLRLHGGLTAFCAKRKIDEWRVWKLLDAGDEIPAAWLKKLEPSRK